jgi:hypothetical protein
VSDTGCDIHHGVAPGFSGQAVVDFLWLAEGPPQERLGSAAMIFVLAINKFRIIFDCVVWATGRAAL